MVKVHIKPGMEYTQEQMTVLRNCICTFYVSIHIMSSDIVYLVISYFVIYNFFAVFSVSPPEGLTSHTVTDLGCCVSIQIKC